MKHEIFIIGHNEYFAWNRALLRLMESGEVDRIKDKWWRDGQCGSSSSSSNGKDDNNNKVDEPPALCSWELSCLLLSMAAMIVLSVLASLLELLLVPTEDQEREGRGANFKRGVTEAVGGGKRKKMSVNEDANDEEKEALKKKEANENSA